MKRLLSAVSLLLVLNASLAGDCFAARSASRSAEVRQVGRYMKLWVIGGEATITLRDPLGRVAQASDSTAWSRIPACSTGVNPPLRAEENSQIAVHGGFFFVREPLVGSWTLQVRRDAAPRYSMAKGSNVGVYAERHSLPDSTNWADERDRAWLAKGQTMTWKVTVGPPAARDSAWLHLIRKGTKKR